jgi:hypothetical protein
VCDAFEARAEQVDDEVDVTAERRLDDDFLLVGVEPVGERLRRPLPRPIATTASSPGYGCVDAPSSASVSATASRPRRTACWYGVRSAGSPRQVSLPRRSRSAPNSASRRMNSGPRPRRTACATYAASSPARAAFTSSLACLRSCSTSIATSSGVARVRVAGWREIVCAVLRPATRWALSAVVAGSSAGDDRAAPGAGPRTPER